MKKFFLVLVFLLISYSVLAQDSKMEGVNNFISKVFMPPTKEEIQKAKKLLPAKYACEGFKETSKIVFQSDEVKAVGVEYKSDGLTIYGILAYPKKEGKYPLIMYNHGGFTGLGSIDKKAIFYLVDEGYVVMASAYRGEKGPDGKSEGNIELAKGEVNDILNLLECGKKLPQVNAKKICFVGGSHGGVNSLLAAERNKDVSCVLEYAGPTDMFADNFKDIVKQILTVVVTKKGKMPFIDAEVIPFLVDTYQNVQSEKDAVEKTRLELILRSPLYFVEDLNVGLFMVHGDIDTMVPLYHTEKLAKKLDELKKPYTLKVYPGQWHFIWGSALDEMGILGPEFLNKYLK